MPTFDRNQLHVHGWEKKSDEGFAFVCLFLQRLMATQKTVFANHWQIGYEHSLLHQTSVEILAPPLV